MLPLSQEQKHQALMQLRSGVSTSKVGTLVGMSQPYVAHLKKDVQGTRLRDKEEGHPKLLANQEKMRCVTLVTKGRLGVASATTKQGTSETSRLLSDITVRRALRG